MRRLLLLLLPLVLLCACTTAPAEQADAPFSFYYRCAEIAYGSEDGVIRAEAAPLEADADLRTVVLQYLKGPASPELRTPLPADWALESIGLTEGTAELVFSRMPCRSLDRTILNACLARTLLQLPGVQRVSILRSGDGAADVLAAKDILLRDNGMEEQEEELVLYVPDEAQRYLVRETQTVAAMNAADRPAEIVRRLLALPESESAIPEGAALRSVSVENGVCTVDLSSQFLTGMPRSWNTERLAVYAIVNSLTELPQIHRGSLDRGRALGAAVCTGAGERPCTRRAHDLCACTGRNAGRHAQPDLRHDAAAGAGADAAHARWGHQQRAVCAGGPAGARG